MELWDLYDAHRRPLNRTHVRGEPLSPGEFHLVAEVCTVNRKGELLLTLRSGEKQKYPNLWECTGGSVLAGEESLPGAVRELFEETGIRAAPEELRYLCSTAEPFDAPFCHMDFYLLVRDVPLTDLVMQPGETVSARWAGRDEVADMIRSGQIARPVAERLVRQGALMEAALREMGLPEA